MKSAVVTAVRGRGSHLRNQLKGLDRSHIRADRHVVVAVDDDHALETMRSRDGRTLGVPLRTGSARIPMAQARNLGAKVAIDDGAADRQELDRVTDAISALPMNLKEALVLRTIEGLSQAETADVLGISQKAVETRLYRDRSRLLEKLNTEQGIGVRDA